MSHLSLRSVASLAFAIALAVSLAGCSSPKPMQPAGFLESYDGLTLNKNGNYSAIDASVSLKDYDAFIVDEPVVKFRPGANADAVPAEVRQKAVRYMRAAIVNAVGEHYAVVDKAGPGVVRWRSAITDIRATGDEPGGAAAEIELVDSVSGKRIVAVVADDDAPKVKGEKPTEWHDARAVMDIWAGRIKQHFDDVWGVKSEPLPKP